MSDIVNPNPNAWLVILSKDVQANKFQISIPNKYQHLDKVFEGDIFVSVENSQIMFFARVFRKREKLNETIFYFDGNIEIKKSLDISQFGITQDLENPITRMIFNTYEKMLEEGYGISHKNFPMFSGEKADEQAHIRNVLQLAVIDDLLGPADGPNEEIIGMSVRDRYLVGKLAPIEKDENQKVIQIPKEEIEEAKENLIVYANDKHNSLDKTSATDFEDDEEKEIDASSNRSLVPSAMGFTFYVDANADTIILSVSWGHYDRTESKKIDEKRSKPFRCWKRIPQGGKKELKLVEGKIKFSPDEDCASVMIEGNISSIQENGTRLVTIFMVNTANKPPQNQDQAWVFQPEMSVSSKDGQPVFHRRPIQEQMKMIVNCNH